MLIKFELDSFKNFQTPITIDFTDVSKYNFNTDCIKDKVLSKMLIYGKNATGKTNLGRAILDIKNNLSYTNKLNSDYEDSFVNISSNNSYARFKYTFRFDNDEAIYEYKKSSSFDLIEETLYVNDNKIFNCYFKNNSYSFENLKKVCVDTINTDIYEEYISHHIDDFDIKILSFLSWLIKNSVIDENNILSKINKFVKNMGMATITFNNSSAYNNINNNFTKYLYLENKLSDFENFLNYMGVKCKLIIKEVDGNPKLYFDYDGRHLSFFENLSSGTKTLTNLYRYLILNKFSSSFLYLDEFDAFYHHELTENLLKYLKRDFPDTQIIMTTHNTNLMTNEIMRPDCIFILSSYGKLTPLNKATLREIREGHNLEKLYISGEFKDYE